MFYSEIIESYNKFIASDSNIIASDISFIWSDNSFIASDNSFFECGFAFTTSLSRKNLPYTKICLFTPKMILFNNQIRLLILRFYVWLIDKKGGGSGRLKKQKAYDLF